MAENTCCHVVFVQTPETVIGGHPLQGRLLAWDAECVESLLVASGLSKGNFGNGVGGFSDDVSDCVLENVEKFA